MTFRLPHLLAALTLHAALLALLIGGVQCSFKPQRPPIISAVLLDPSRQEAAQQKREEQRRQEERRKAEQDRKQREQEAQRRQQAEQEKQRQAEQQRQAKAEAARKKKEEAAQKKQAAEQKKAEDLARRKQEQEEKKEQAAAAKRELEEKIRLEQAMRDETVSREAAREQAARAASEREAHLAQWADALSRHIASNWARPPGAAEDFECTLRVQQLPDGTVTSASIVKSCGNASLDKSVEDAVFRSSPLPRPADPSVFDRDLNIRFIPQ